MYKKSIGLVRYIPSVNSYDRSPGYDMLVFLQNHETEQYHLVASYCNFSGIIPIIGDGN